MKDTKMHVEQRSGATMRNSVFICAFLYFIFMLPYSLWAQEKQLIQVKTFDQQLNPFRNVEVSVNDKPFVAVGARGTGFVELAANELPIKTVKIKNEQLEAATWNLSKGTLEIIIRTKSFRVISVTVKDAGNVIQPNLKVIFHGKQKLTLTTNAEGVIEIPVALNEKIEADQFVINDYNMVGIHLSDRENILTIEKVIPVVAEEPVATVKKPGEKQILSDFDFSKLDSIQSLTVFYAIFRNYEIRDLDPETKRRVDAKFNSLVKSLEDSLRNVPAFIGKISDSSFVRDDLKNLVAQVQVESQSLEMQRDEFDKKIRIIEEKLSSGISNLDNDTRAQLLSELTTLERLLIENANQFYKNQEYYREVIATLKEKFFDISDLENRLSESEAQRIEQQRVFRQRLIIISGVVLVFGVMIVLLISFSNALRKQKKELVRANNEIKRINENLERLVYERTRMLAEANKELDTFLYRASHDLRSPVRSILGLCNIASHVANPESQDLLTKVISTTFVMDKLLKKLSMISEINQPTDFSPINIRNMVERSLYTFGKGIRDHNVSVLIDCSPDLSFESYPHLLEGILHNLIENALFYSLLKDTENARIEITARIKEDFLELSVYDNGIGVEHSIRANLFDMFFKGHEHSKGNGLGLYIVLKSVQTLNGEVTVESEPGQFTRFVLQLPLHSEPTLRTGDNGAPAMIVTR